MIIHWWFIDWFNDDSKQWWLTNDDWWYQWWWLTDWRLSIGITIVFETIYVILNAQLAMV